jgi:putative ABC transport system ATP-binding protein
VSQPAYGVRDVGRWIGLILAPDATFLRLALIYGLAISLLSLATPISVQLLINSVANTALTAPLFTLSAMLLMLLLLVGVLSAFRVHLMALFERRLFGRIVAEITLREVHARNPFFTDARQGALFNRYFDLMTVQKALPSLLIGSFTILLQGVVGLVVTSFYHPFFLAFNALLLLLLYLVWQIWTGGAIRTAVVKSHAKHATAHWLESVGGSNGFYQSARHLNYAIARSEAMTEGWVRAHEKHFRYTFSQTVCLLLIYAFASAALLALGGWLIIQGQLSIGQLVAAELILSSVFYGIAQFGPYLEAFYDLAAGLEELSLFWDIQQDEPRGDNRGPANGTIKLKGAEYGQYRLDFGIASGEQVAIVSAPGVERCLSLLLKRHETPERGLVLIGGSDIGHFDIFRLRSEVIVLARASFVEMTIREFLELASFEKGGDISEAVEIAGLSNTIASLPDGFDAMISTSGSPLSVGELMALKLAGALLARPRVLCLSQLYDLLAPESLDASLRTLRDHGTTVLQFTQRPEAASRDRYLWLGPREHHFCVSAGELIAVASEQGSGDA